MNVDKENVRSILVIKLRGIGDVLLSTAVLENLRATYLQARIDFLTEYASREVIEGSPYISSAIVFNAKQEGSVRVIEQVRRQRYDLVLDLFCNPRSAIISALSGARYRVGYPFGWRKHCYNILVTPRGGEVHNTEFNLDALRKIGVPIYSNRPMFPIDMDAERFADEFFQKENLTGTPIVALNAGGGWYTKRWGLGRYAELADRLVQEFDARVLIAWGPGELENAKEIHSLMKNLSLLFPATSLKQLGAILKRCTLLVTNDSGPMHIASALGTPVVAIFGPTNPELQGPVGNSHMIVRNEKLLCLGCNYTRCPIGNPCMLELSVEEVFRAAQTMLKK